MTPKAAISIHVWQADGILLERYAYTAGAVEPLPKHAHEEYQLGLSFDCSGEYRYRGEKHCIPTGSLSLLHSGEVHSPSDRTSLPAPASFWMMHIHPAWLQSITAEIHEKAAGFPCFPGIFITDAVLNHLFLKLHAIANNPTSQLEQDIAIWQFLSYLVVQSSTGRFPAALRRSEQTAIRIFRFGSRSASIPRPLAAGSVDHAENRPCLLPHSSSHAGVRLARDYLHAHYANEISLDQLADIAGLSRFHFCRIFRKQVGLSPGTYQTQLRIAQAKKLLMQGMAIATVADLTGFYDQSHFGGHFKRQVGVTPNRYGSKAAKFS